MDEVVLISAVTTTKYSMVASLTFLVYDYLLNFDVELEFVWKLRWSFGKMLYLFNRYFAPVALSVNMIVFFGDFVTAQQL
ncbi:hypothetical protein K439DRAFT_778639 [Ramaria rubella]|nr:hypothetical protein K439DRAFT_778639 [Ramaria rubella]